jgi:ATP-dependent HslUV protease, peptidase subunit HslV
MQLKHKKYSVTLHCFTLWVPSTRTFSTMYNKIVLRSINTMSTLPRLIQQQHRSVSLLVVVSAKSPTLWRPNSKTPTDVRLATNIPNRQLQQQQQQQNRSFHASSLSFNNNNNNSNNNRSNTYHGTTILCVRKNGKVCMMGDGMVSMGNMTIKPNAIKIQRLFAKGTNQDTQKATLVGFAGATADAFTLLERLEGKLEEYPGQLSRSCVELAKGWRTDKYLRRLEASLIVADESKSLEITGNGDVLEMTDGVISIGSGSPFALGKWMDGNGWMDGSDVEWIPLLMLTITSFQHPLLFLYHL